MNSRARNRLIGVTVIILGLAAAVFFAAGPSTYSSTVQAAVGDPSLLGKRIKVKGPVVVGSWDKTTNPMRFKLGAEGKTGGPELSVIYSGSAPSTFGDGVVAIVTGTIEKGAVMKADDMTTVCPANYSSESAYTVADLLKRTTEVPFIRVYGYLKPKSLVAAGQATDRFVLTSTASGGKELRVRWDKVMPAGSADGAQMVISGRYDGAGVLVASEVAMLGAAKK